ALTDQFGTHVAAPHNVRVNCHDITLEAQAWQGTSGLQLMLYGSDSNKQRLVQYLTLLCFNANDNFLPLDTYFLAWAKGKYTVRYRHIDPFPQDVAQQLLDDICQLYQSMLSAPVPAFIDLTLALLDGFEKWQKNHDDGMSFSYWLTSEDGASCWQNALKGGYMTASLNDDPYVRWFFPTGLAMSDFPAQPLANVFTPLYLNRKDKKVK
ncbi:hypothetical protein, partial [Alteromonas sp. 14N.309.X.WAT.G.H12]|uniref:hypothetical protein n=1 Tax=Alteromonas sp. 14N.309.X.WAT.G.H12 TaxID=3120824 RepID=UPI002FD0664D